MPPKAANNMRRKGPSFKPPRPVQSTAQSSSTAKRVGAAAARPSGATKVTASRSGFRPAATIISSDEEQDDDNDDALSDGDELMEDTSEDENPPQAGPLQTSMAPIPAPLLARLLHEHFEDGETQIQKGAMNLFGSYISIFVREAIARAKDERDRAAKRGGRAEAFLQVEDLEKLAPQLVLDF